MLPKVAIVGRPNVGKSTIFNRIIGERLSITDDVPGVTRDRIYARAEWGGRKFNVIDTGGIQISDVPFLASIRAQAEIAMEESDLIVFVTDVKSGLVAEDLDVMKLLRQAKKPVLLVVNKVDDLSLMDGTYDFYALGADEMIPVSGVHGIGIGDLLEAIVARLPEDSLDEYAEETCRLCVIGRPGVGKSSLVNAILGTERVLVSDRQGTTTDAVDTPFEKDGKRYVVVDTAGLRKRGKIFEGVEKYSALRAMEAIERADVCLIVIDAIAGIQEQDKHVAGYAFENGKAMILVVNKWDAVPKTDKTMGEYTETIRKEFQFLDFVPVVFLSAKTRQRVATLFPLIETVFENYNRRIPTSVLNEVLSDAVSYFPPKEVLGVKLRIYYASQVAVKCPSIVLFVNDPEALHWSYGRYLENRIRERFAFEGSPIKLILRRRD